MKKPPVDPRPWYFHALRVVIFSVVVLPLCGWGGFRLWSFFSPKPPQSPPKGPSSGTSVLLEEKTETDEPQENALLEGVKENNLIEYPADNDIRMKILECESIESRIAEIEDLIKRSAEESRRIEAKFDAMHSLGIGQKEIEKHRDYPALEDERKFQETQGSEIDRLLLKIRLLEEKYPQSKIRHPENRASSSHLEESGSLLSPDEILSLKRGHTRSIQKERAKSAKRAIHRRRIMKRLGSSSSRAPRILDSSTTTPDSASNSGNLRISSGTEDSGHD